MDLLITDFGGFEEIGKGDVWTDLEEALGELPLYLKHSEQAGKVGSYIFDPVATNETIKKRVEKEGLGNQHPYPCRSGGPGHGRRLRQGRFDR